MSRRVAILGATGLVGRTMLQLLEERDFPVSTLELLASDRPSRPSLTFRDQTLAVKPVQAESFDRVEIALFATENAVSERWASVAQAAGAHVVDNSSAFRYAEGIPLVVPEVNGELLASRPTLVANPNCSTIALVMTLAPLARAVGLERVVVATYQAASGGGAQALERLEHGIQADRAGSAMRGADGLPPFAFNVVPQIDRFEANGYSREEMKVVWETRKILGLPELPVSATAVRVPVRVGHSVAVHVILGRAVTPDQARAWWREFPGLEVVDEPERGRYPMPIDVAGKDAVLVGRARADLSHPRGLVYFLSSDNLRKGAALNAVQIAEQLCGERMRTR